MAKVSLTRSADSVPTPEVLPFGERATAISISESGRLVYSAHSRDTVLHELALAGRSVRPLAASFSSTLDEHTPHYSPDGARVAFASTRSCRACLPGSA